MKACGSLFIAACCCALISCGSTQTVRVLKNGESNVTASLGGPVVPSKSPVILIPNVLLGVVHGISDRTSVMANVHALPAVFGTLGLDVGVATRIRHENGVLPEVTLKVQGLVFSDFTDLRLYPLVSAVASYEIGDRMLAYANLEALYQFHDSRVFLSPTLGLQFPLTSRWSMQTELAWMAMNVNTSSGAFEGIGSIGSHGGIAFFAGVAYAL